eukprot:gb/GEZN01004230.1/.p1 GENE.gb/GEZN01004230.1/~~gb/GEZN01004230.1/.p1  ORF type:complete len:584 (+),score=128.62 gb/GEZN01004230.1/:246-1754(+)
MSELQQKYEQLKQEYKQCRKDLKKWQEEAEKLQGMLDAQKAEHAEFLKDKGSTLSELQQKYEELMQEYKQSRKDSKKHLQDLKRAQSNLETLEAEHSQLKEEQQRGAKLCEDHEATLKSLRAEIKSLQTGVIAPQQLKISQTVAGIDDMLADLRSERTAPSFLSKNASDAYQDKKDKPTENLNILQSVEAVQDKHEKLAPQEDAKKPEKKPAQQIKRRRSKRTSAGLESRQKEAGKRKQTSPDAGLQPQKSTSKLASTTSSPEKLKGKKVKRSESKAKGVRKTKRASIAPQAEKQITTSERSSAALVPEGQVLDERAAVKPNDVVPSPTPSSTSGSSSMLHSHSEQSLSGLKSVFDGISPIASVTISSAESKRVGRRRRIFQPIDTNLNDPQLSEPRTKRSNAVVRNLGFAVEKQDSPVRQLSKKQKPISGTVPTTASTFSASMSSVSSDNPPAESFNIGSHNLFQQFMLRPPLSKNKAGTLAAPILRVPKLKGRNGKDMPR